MPLCDVAMFLKIHCGDLVGSLRLDPSASGWKCDLIKIIQMIDCSRIAYLLKKRHFDGSPLG